jgi:hypothetical protein
MICAVAIDRNRQKGRTVAIMKARAMRKPIFRERAEETETAKIAGGNQEIARLLGKEEQVKRYLEDIRTATEALERILAKEKGKSTYEIKYVADIEDYCM